MPRMHGTKLLSYNYGNFQATLFCRPRTFYTEHADLQKDPNIYSFKAKDKTTFVRYNHFLRCHFWKSSVSIFWLNYIL